MIFTVPPWNIPIAAMSRDNRVRFALGLAG